MLEPALFVLVASFLVFGVLEIRDGDLLATPLLIVMAVSFVCVIIGAVTA